MMKNRTWITREEIAEIHEVISEASPSEVEYLSHAKAARDIRATDLLENRLGSRVA